METTIVSLLSVVLAALLAMPFWMTRSINSLRDNLSAKIDATNDRIDQQRIELSAQINATNNRIDKQRIELTAHIDEQRTELSAQIDALSRDVTGLRERMARIETRLPEAPVPAGN